MSSALNVGLVIFDANFRDELSACLQRLDARVVFAVADAAKESHKLENTNPDVLVLDFGQTSSHVVMADLKLHPRRPAVIGAHTTADPDVVLAALRSGAREFVYPPVNETALRGALDTIASERMLRESRKRSGKAIGFLSASGSCGATTIACHVAAELRRIAECDVTVTDFDLTGGMAGFWFRANGPYSVLDAVNNLARLDPSFWKGIVSTVQPRLDVLAAPSHIPLGDLPSPRRLADILRFARASCEWVVADLGQGMGPLAATLAPDLDALYLVTCAEVAALYQTRRIIRALVDSGFRREAIKLVVSRVRKGQPFGQQEIEKLLAFPVELVLPEDDHEVGEAHAGGRLVSPKCELGKRILQLAAAIAGKPVEESRPSRFSPFRFRAQEA